MLNAILLRVVLFLCARGADENSRGIEVTRRERHEKVPLLVVDDSLPPLSKKNKITRIEHVSRPRFFSFSLSCVRQKLQEMCAILNSFVLVLFERDLSSSSVFSFLFFFSLFRSHKRRKQMISSPTTAAMSRPMVVRKSSCSSAAGPRNSRLRLHPSVPPSRRGAIPRNRGTARVRTQARAQATKQKAHHAHTVDELAFLDIVTVDSLQEAPETFARWGIVRIPNLLSEAETTELLEGAKKYGVRRHAFAQESQKDRYTLWLAGDGMSEEQQKATKTMQSNVPCMERALLKKEDNSTWRAITDAFGYPNLMLGEVVTSVPGGIPQDWHFDGEGITAQISLVSIDEQNGPTEVQPRPVPRVYMTWVNRMANQMQGKQDDEILEALQELTTEIKQLYDRLTKAHEFAWSTIRPIIGNSLPAARALIEAGLTPPIVRLTADVGCLTLYDAAMIHRGGENRTDTERPILAVHINKENKEQRHMNRIEESDDAIGKKLKKGRKKKSGSSR